MRSSGPPPAGKTARLAPVELFRGGLGGECELELWQKRLSIHRLSEGSVD